MINIDVSNIIKININDIHNSEFLSLITNKFTYLNPEYWKIKKMGYYISEKDKYIKAYNIKNGHLLLPRGSVTGLRILLDSYNIKYKIIDNRISIPHDITFNNKLYNIQLSAAQEMSKYTQRLLIAPPACGKTRIMLKLISLINQKTIIVVHTSEIFKHWFSEIKSSLDINKIGTIGLGKRIIAPVTIAMIQTLWNFKKRDWRT